MWSSRASMHSRYSIRDEAAQQSESHHQCVTRYRWRYPPTIFNLNGQVLGDGAHNSRPGGARLPVCCDAADRGQFRTAAAACRAAAPATAVRALAKLPPGERSAVRSKQWCGDVMSRLSLRLAGISTSAVSCMTP
jgi:hypothetical protein